MFRDQVGKDRIADSICIVTSLQTDSATDQFSLFSSSVMLYILYAAWTHVGRKCARVCFCARTNAHSFSLVKIIWPTIFRCTKLRYIKLKKCFKTNGEEVFYRFPSSVMLVLSNSDLSLRCVNLRVN